MFLSLGKNYIIQLKVLFGILVSYSAPGLYSFQPDSTLFMFVRSKYAVITLHFR